MLRGALQRHHPPLRQSPRDNRRTCCSKGPAKEPEGEFVAFVVLIHQTIIRPPYPAVRARRIANRDAIPCAQSTPIRPSGRTRPVSQRKVHCVMGHTSHLRTTSRSHQGRRRGDSSEGLTPYSPARSRRSPLLLLAWQIRAASRARGSAPRKVD